MPILDAASLADCPPLALFLLARRAWVVNLQARGTKKWTCPSLTWPEPRKARSCKQQEDANCRQEGAAEAGRRRVHHDTQTPKLKAGIWRPDLQQNPNSRQESGGLTYSKTQTPKLKAGIWRSDQR